MSVVPTSEIKQKNEALYVALQQYEQQVTKYTELKKQFTTLATELQTVQTQVFGMLTELRSLYDQILQDKALVDKQLPGVDISIEDLVNPPAPPTDNLSRTM